jgi:membrane associated rhomboid family serine protease
MPGPVGTAAGDWVKGALGTEFLLTKLYIALCAVVFVVTTVSGGKLELLGADPFVVMQWGALAGNPAFGSLGVLQPWRYLSAMFVHFGALHIVFNMMALWDVGRAVEQRLGSARFTIIFVVTGVVGFLASDVWFSVIRSAPYLTAGASGGLFGLVGALIGYAYAARDPMWKKFLTRFAILALVFAIALPVNNAAHIGGFAAGAPLGYLAFRERRPWRLSPVFGLLAGGLTVASLVSVILSRIYVP